MLHPVGRSGRSVFNDFRYDVVFIFGTFALALTLGALASISASMLMAVVFLDVWLFANPHIIATYTRIGSNKADVKKHWFLIFILPALVLVAVAVIAVAYEVAGLFTFYLFAQTYHVSRQSFGIARAYKRLAPQPFLQDRLSQGLIYLFPLWGLLNWCAQDSAVFLGYPISLPVVSPVLVNTIGGIAVVAAVWWVLRQYRKAPSDGSSQRHDWFLVSHVCIFAVAYLWVNDLTLGWLMVNIWHNFQYLLFVWSRNRKQEALSPDHVNSVAPSAFMPTRLVLPWKSASKYAAFCLLAGAAFYEVLDVFGRQLLWLGLPTVLILHFTINFHHYLVDGVIWKRRHRSSED
jgi:hypothetical protein